MIAHFTSGETAPVRIVTRTPLFDVALTKRPDGKSRVIFLNREGGLAETDDWVESVREERL